MWRGSILSRILNGACLIIGSFLAVSAIANATDSLTPPIPEIVACAGPQGHLRLVSDDLLSVGEVGCRRNEELVHLASASSIENLVDTAAQLGNRINSLEQETGALNASQTAILSELAALRNTAATQDLSSLNLLEHAIFETLRSGGMLSWWPADQSPLDATILADVLSSSPGQVVGARWAVGPDRQALDFDGIDDYVSVESTDHLDFSSGQDITISLWVNPRSLAGLQVLLIKGHATIGVANYALMTVEDKLRFLYWSPEDGDWHIWQTALPVLTPNQWHQVSISYTFGQSQTLVAYVDGHPVHGSWVRGTGSMSPVKTEDPLLFGLHTPSSPGSLFSGVLDDIRIYRRILQPSEMQLLAVH